MRTGNFTKEELLHILVAGIKRFYREENHLLVDEVCERAVAFRLGTKLLNRFKPADVYAEYNRRHDPDGFARKKRLGNLQDTSYPDLLVFRRIGEDDTPDKIAIEMKMGYQESTSNDYIADREKLKVLTDPNEDDFNYILGIHLIMNVDRFYLCGYEQGTQSFIQRFVRTNGKWEQKELWPHSYLSYDDLESLPQLPRPRSES